MSCRSFFADHLTQFHQINTARSSSNLFSTKALPRKKWQRFEALNLRVGLKLLPETMLKTWQRSLLSLGMILMFHKNSLNVVESLPFLDLRRLTRWFQMIKMKSIKWSRNENRNLKSRLSSLQESKWTPFQ